MANKLNRLAKMVAAGSTELTSNIFTNRLTKFIETSQKDYTPSQFYKPSGIGGCMRKMYFERIGKPLQDKASFNLTGMGETGTYRHEVLQEYILQLAKTDEDLEWIDVAEHLSKHPVEGTYVDKAFKKNPYETKCVNELMQLSFLCDGLIRFQGKLYILEIKTETMFKYSKHTEPYEEHKMQAACYGLSLGVKDVLFLYENRDNFDKKAYTYHINEDIENAVIDKLSTCEEFVTAGESPNEFCNSAWCPYCRKEGRLL